MRKLTLFGIFMLTTAWVAYGQNLVSTFKSLDPVISDIQGSKPTLAKARRLYYEGRNSSAESMYLQLIELRTMETEDYLRFSLVLFQNGRTGLAKEIYKEYVRVSNKTNKTFERLMNEVSDHGLPDQPNTSLLMKLPVLSASKTALDDLCAVTAQQLSLYNISPSASALKEIQKTKLSGLLIHSYTLINENLAVVSAMDEDYFELYIVERIKGLWKKPKMLSLGIKGNKVLPNYDVKTGMLYFSAKVTKEKGFDIYSAIFNDQNLSFTQAVALGDDVNTPKDELCPVFINDELFFASDGWPGFGGFDIYSYHFMKSTLTHRSDVNSFDDEVGYITDFQGNQFVMTSSEKGANLSIVRPKSAVKKITPKTKPVETKEKPVVDIKDQIEQKPIIRDAPAQPAQISGTVVDQYSKPIENARVLLFSDEMSGAFAITGQDGIFLFNEIDIELPAMVNVFVEGSTPLELKMRKMQDNIFMISLNNIAVSSAGDDDTEPSLEPVHVDVPPQTVHPRATPVPTDVGRYYIVIASVTSHALAYDYWSKWVSKFPNSEIMEFENGRYRVVTYAGGNRTDAMAKYRECKPKKKDVWLLTPQ